MKGEKRRDIEDDPIKAIKETFFFCYWYVYALQDINSAWKGRGRPLCFLDTNSSLERELVWLACVSHVPLMCLLHTYSLLLYCSLCLGCT